MDLDMQIELFEQALEEIAADGDLVNMVLDITLENDDQIHIRRYALPTDNGL